ncbi:MAG: diacylglycerol kinase [Nitrospinaceae bacterium]|nr:MAG: diacylglycerol kinase [Nitrospinaceae bacterium]
MLEESLKHLKEYGLQCDLHGTKGPHEAESAVQKAVHSQSYHAVVAAGGDGTINEVANGLLGTDLPLGIIPLGTVNVLAKELGYSLEPDQAARSIAFGPTQAVHVGNANGRAFLLMVGAGFDGRAVAGVSPTLKRSFGQAAYMIAGLKELFFKRPAKLVVDIDGSRYQTSWVVISNSCFYGGKYLLAAETGLQSRGFEVSLVAGETRWALVRSLMEMALSRKTKPGWKQIAPVNRITVTASQDEPVQMDGDNFAVLPLTVTPAESPLQVIMPFSSVNP